MGKRVTITAPSGNVLDLDAIDRAKEKFESRGWSVKCGITVYTSNKRFAGASDQSRVDDFNNCLDKSDLVLCARGGYGISRIIDKIDYDKIERNGTWVAGFSDITLFNLAYLALKGGKSLQSPTASVLGKTDTDSYTDDCFFEAISSKKYSVHFPSGFEGNFGETGLLWGGNLSVIASAIGTPYMPNIEKGILFVEDVGEPVYSVERDLLHLLQAGILGKQACVLAGRFTETRDSAHDFGFCLADVYSYISKESGIPVICGLPFGHIPRMCTLVVGSQAGLEVNDGQAVLSIQDAPGLGTGE